jgi:hypothetical protein
MITSKTGIEGLIITLPEPRSFQMEALAAAVADLPEKIIIPRQGRISG